MKTKLPSLLALSLISPICAFASENAQALSVLGIRVEFIIFTLTLLGVALFHHHTLYVAASGLLCVLLVKLGFSNFDLLLHVKHEWRLLLNLFGLLIGFAILAKHFESTKIPELLPKFLPDDWKGGLVLLFLVMALSAFLDNIAAAIIGGTMAAAVFKGKLHIGYIAAIVAASNAGGAGSVVGDTTTTMMWIDGVAALDVFEASLGAIVAFLVFGTIASKQQFKHQPIVKDASSGIKLNLKHLIVVAMILAGAIITNVKFDFPAIGVWVAILLGAIFVHTEWSEIKGALKGTLFLLSLVLTASMMPVESLPTASWQTALGLGFLSAVFDNIPLTKLALDQGGYDWGFLAYAVGFGGSMIWFGSSAGVAISNLFPEAKSVGAWIKGGWHIPIAYVAGFAAMLLILGWHPHPKHKTTPASQHNEALAAESSH